MSNSHAATRAPVTASVSGGSRRRRRARGQPRRFGRMSDRAIGRYVGWAMIALTALYVGNAFYQVRLAGAVYGYLARGASHAEVRYLMGPPTATDGAAEDAATQWTYVQGSARTQVRFDAGGVTRISCTDSQPTELSCPATMGFGLTTAEPDIWYRLGRPTRETYLGDVKRIDYAELGLSFELRRMSVTAITLDRRPGPLSFVPRAVRSLLP